MDNLGNERGGGKARRINFVLSFLCKTKVVPCKEDPYLENCAQRTLGAEDFLCLGFARRGGGRFPLFSFVYIPLRGERR
jgi:hypothetical protein